MKAAPWCLASCLLLGNPLSASEVVSERLPAESASSRFVFKTVPRPSRQDAGGGARWVLVDGTRDANGGDLRVLHDGRLPADEDHPASNFFFQPRSDGGRVLVDLGSVIQIRQINTYSWHPAGRGPQVYTVYGSDGKPEGFQQAPKNGVDPEAGGWTRIARVDTRPEGNADMGGQYGVRISGASGPLGSFQYLLFVFSCTNPLDIFSNTFYSEIDIVDWAAPEVSEPEPEPAQTRLHTLTAGEGKYTITVDVTAAPDLAEWVEKELAPVVQEWYPKIVELLPSDGFEAPARVSILFREGMGSTPASAQGSRINCNIGWFRRNLAGEARGSVVHELVHVVQQYGRARRVNPNPSPTPGWLVEGIPDYIRWFLYEPQSRGAEIGVRQLDRARFDASYRISANFLHWAVQAYDPLLVRKLNAAARNGEYREALWREWTGKTVQELGAEWRKKLEEQLGVAASGTTAQADAP